MEKTDLEEWERIGEIVKQIDRDVTGLVDVLGTVPKSEWREEHARASEAISELKSELENRMAEEHPDEWGTGVFYGTAELDPSWEE